MTPEEHKLIMKFLESRDMSILDHVIDNPHAYSVEMVEISIGLQYVVRMPQRVVCWNSILIDKGE